MTMQEFLDKLESEGVAYAFQEYGLSEDDLDSDVTYHFFKAVRDARIAYQDALALEERIYAAAPQ